jgi:hypothetical protein
MAVEVRIYQCPNPACRDFSMTAELFEAKKMVTPQSAVVWLPKQKDSGVKWDLVPAARVRQFPNYVPQPILDDYQEACLIQNLSPKASATLSRRALQGMIRDFFGVTKDTLFKEIDAIKGRPEVPSGMWNAIDALRKVGNIGAHMEKDINIIVDVEPEEAEQLIGLVETLIIAWYVARHEQQEQLRAITALGAAKVAAKKP